MNAEQFINQFGAVMSMAQGRRFLALKAVKINGTTPLTDETLKQVKEGDTIHFGKHRQYTVRKDHLP